MKAGDAEPHGTRVFREAPRAGRPRRVREVDANGADLTILRWTEDGALGHAWIKIADDSWVMIEPRARYDSTWGLCDRLWHAVHPTAAAHTPLTTFEALTYEAIDRIPVLMEPARLPPGAGAAVLNLVAALAADQDRAGLAYHGPYPTEQLFLTLLESYRYRTDDPLAAFMAGRLQWSPAPYERVGPAPGVTVHLRGRVDKVIWRERLYYRPDWQGVHRHAPRRVRDVDGAVVCSLWALGEAIEDHLRLATDVTGVEIIAPPRVTLPRRPLPAAALAGIASAAAALSAPPLAPFIRQVAATYDLSWSSLDGDLVAVERSHLRISHRLRESLTRRLRTTTTRAQRLALSLAAITELAHLFGDPLRARAQSHLATLPERIQAEILSDEAPADARTGDAERIAQAVESLLADTMPG